MTKAEALIEFLKPTIHIKPKDIAVDKNIFEVAGKKYFILTDHEANEKTRLKIGKFISLCDGKEYIQGDYFIYRIN